MFSAAALVHMWPAMSHRRGALASYVTRLVVVVLPLLTGFVGPEFSRKSSVRISRVLEGRKIPWNIRNLIVEMVAGL